MVRGAIGSGESPASGVTTDSSQPAKFRTRCLVAFQVLVSAGLLGWLFIQSDFRRDLASVLLSARWEWLCGAFLTAGVVQGLCLVRWRIFLGMVGLSLGWKETCGIFFAGLFCNLILPGAAGGDVVRIGLLAARKRDIGLASLSVLMDRLAGSLGMILVGSTLIISEWRWLSQSHIVANVSTGILVWFAVLGTGLGLSLVLAKSSIVGCLPMKFPGRTKLVSLAAVYRQCGIQWPHTLLAVAVSCIMLVLYFLVFAFAGRAYGVEMPIWQFLALMPAVDIISALPVSLGGFGVRESLFVLLLGQLAAVPSAVAVSISLCGYIVNALWALPGAALWMLREAKK